MNLAEYLELKERIVALHLRMNALEAAVARLTDACFEQVNALDDIERRAELRARDARPEKRVKAA